MQKAKEADYVYSEGMRLKCEVCQREIVILKVGKGPVYCCGRPMQPVE
ncbi:MAG: hypothetical protein HZA77_08020 [Candidatus Schekmanbacteria bacterium]|nr:hypothetical protein [Candidatus Schekmanbacteria bacterium]